MLKFCRIPRHFPDLIRAINSTNQPLKLLYATSVTHCTQMTVTNQHHKFPRVCSSGLNPQSYTLPQGCPYQINQQYNRLFSSNTTQFQVTGTSEGLVSKIRRKLGFPPNLRYSKSRLADSGMKLYTCIVESSDYEQFFDDFKLPDTLLSWYIVMELHMWLVSLRLIRMGEDGIHIRKLMIEMMWLDLESRYKATVVTSYKIRKTNLTRTYNRFCTALLAYDEGLLGDDKMLAAAVWRFFFEQEDVDPRCIAGVVEYIRKQSNFMLEQSEDVFLNGQPRFLPLHGSVVDEERYQKIIAEL